MELPRISRSPPMGKRVAFVCFAVSNLWVAGKDSLERRMPGTTTDPTAISWTLCMCTKSLKVIVYLVVLCKQYLCTTFKSVAKVPK